MTLHTGLMLRRGWGGAGNTHMSTLNNTECCIRLLVFRDVWKKLIPSGRIPLGVIKYVNVLNKYIVQNNSKTNLFSVISYNLSIAEMSSSKAGRAHDVTQSLCRVDYLGEYHLEVHRFYDAMIMIVPPPPPLWRYSDGRSALMGSPQQTIAMKYNPRMTMNKWSVCDLSVLLFNGW